MTAPVTSQKKYVAIRAGSRGGARGRGEGKAPTARPTIPPDATDAALAATAIAAWGFTVTPAELVLLTLLARDFRSANNLNGVFLVPVIVATALTLSAVGGPARTYVLSAALLVLAALALVVALRWVTFERYLE